MDRIRQMRIFIQVTESGNFTRAAQVLNMPRWTVSTAIQELEDHLGPQLLRRTTRHMMPTHEGEQFLDTTREVQDTLEAAEQMFRPRSTQLRGRLRIDMPSRIGRRIAIPALPAFLDACPELTLEMSMTDRTVDLVSEGVDCLIRVGELEDSELVCRRLGGIEIITCASPDYLARHGTPQEPDDLVRHRLVNYALRHFRCVRSRLPPCRTWVVSDAISDRQLQRLHTAGRTARKEDEECPQPSPA